MHFRSAHCLRQSTCLTIRTNANRIGYVVNAVLSAGNDCGKSVDRYHKVIRDKPADAVGVIDRVDILAGDNDCAIIGQARFNR